MELIIERANKRDISKILGLYHTVYGDDYPLDLGKNRNATLDALDDGDRFLWLLMRNQRGVLVGSAIFELDLDYKLGKVAGVVVKRSYRGRGIASSLIAHGRKMLLEEDDRINSLYTTTRTLSVASQKMFLCSNFFPLGIFPNARKIRTYETLTLLGAFRDGVLDRRGDVKKVSANLIPILKIVNGIVGSSLEYEMISGSISWHQQVNSDVETEEGFEFIDAPQFVERRFDEIFKDDAESNFYPFHRPNLIAVSDSGDIEIFASFNKQDHYCVIIAANGEISRLGKRFKNLMFRMKDLGIYYVEVLTRIEAHNAVNFLLNNRFIPAAIYPAMREIDGKMCDYVLMTRTMVPLDFSEISIDPRFKPFVEQYTNQWIQLNLDSFEVK